MFGPGDFLLDVYAAQAGTAARVLYHQDLGTMTATPGPQILFLIGWDKVGPLGTYPSSWATQGGGPVHYWGTPVRVDANTGRVLSPVSDPSCSIWDIALSGDFVCVSSTAALSVRRPDGTELWHISSTPNSGYEYELLAPDEQHVAVLGPDVLGRDGTNVKLPNSFYYAGWLDNSTLIGGGYNTNLNYVSLSAPSTVVDIGFKGLFVGTVQT